MIGGYLTCSIIIYLNIIFNTKRMPFNTKFKPAKYQDRDTYNTHVLNERYNTFKGLRESYALLYQEVAACIVS